MQMIHALLCICTVHPIDYAHCTCCIPRADSRFAPSQWETSLQSNAVSHWLGANLESALYTYNTSQVVFSWFMFCCGWMPVSFTHILQDYFTGTGAILRLPQCQWSNPEGYGSIDPKNLLGTHDIITTKESTAKQRAYFMKPRVYQCCVVGLFASLLVLYLHNLTEAKDMCLDFSLLKRNICVRYAMAFIEPITEMERS